MKQESPTKKIEKKLLAVNQKSILQVSANFFQEEKRASKENLRRVVGR